MDPHHLRELMAASRLDDADLGLSEMEAAELRAALAEDAELAAELALLHEWDQALESACDDVPVPEGLAARLKANVQAEETKQADREIRPTAEPRKVDMPSRRRWLIGALGTAAAVGIAATGWYAATRPQVVVREALEAEVQELMPDVAQIVWQDGGEPAGVFPAAVRRESQRWGTIATPLDDEAVVFDLSRRGAPQAVLIAMRVPRLAGDLPARPPMPESSASGYAIGAWESAPYVYVLAVQGSVTRYRLFLNNGQNIAAR